MTNLTLDDLRKLDAMAEPGVEDIVARWEFRGPNAQLTHAEVFALVVSWREARAKALAECEAIARKHVTYVLGSSFPPAFNGGYWGASQKIADEIAALKDKP